MAGINLLYCKLSINRATPTKYSERLLDWGICVAYSVFCQWYEHLFSYCQLRDIFLSTSSCVRNEAARDGSVDQSCSGQDWNTSTAMTDFQYWYTKNHCPSRARPCPWLSSDSPHLNCFVTFVPTCKPHRATASCNSSSFSYCTFHFWRIWTRYSCWSAPYIWNGSLKWWWSSLALTHFTDKCGVSCSTDIILCDPSFLNH